MTEETEILAKYFDFSNIVSSDSAAKLSEYTRINDHLINLLNDKQPFYSLIYSLGMMELEILKSYIKVNLASNFIRPFNSPTNALILFV